MTRDIKNDSTRRKKDFGAKEQRGKKLEGSTGAGVGTSGSGHGSLNMCVKGTVGEDI